MGQRVLRGRGPKEPLATELDVSRFIAGQGCGARVQAAQDRNPLELAGTQIPRQARCRPTCVNSRQDRPRRRAVQLAFTTAVERAALPVTADGGVSFYSFWRTAISRLANDARVGPVYARDFAGHFTLEQSNSDVHKVESAERTAAAAEALSG